MAQADRSPEPEPPPRSPAEERFDRGRRTLGLALGPLAFALLLLLPLPMPTPEAARLLAVLAWVIVWWITEAVPIPVTALLGPALAVVCGVGSASEMFAPFGDPIVLFFLGSFMLAQAMIGSGLDRRFAYAMLARPGVAASPLRLLATFVLVTAGISMWVNNTATTAMLFPIGLSVLAVIEREGRVPARRFGIALMLVMAYASSIGGMATPVGTAPNLIMLGQLAKLADVRIPFFQWMLLATPVAATMLGLLLLALRRDATNEGLDVAKVRTRMAAERADLGPLSRAERNVLAAFAITVALWILPGFLALAFGADSTPVAAVQRYLPESVVAILGAGLCFVLPVDWGQRRFTLAWVDAARLDWGTLLLFGGGLAIGAAMFRSGLAQALGGGIVALTGAHSLVALTFVFAWTSLALTETTSNIATCSMLAPLVIGACQGAGVSPIPPAVAVALAASMGFMLPVGTPPNAIVYSSGRVPITAMMRRGALLDLASALVVPGGVLLVCRMLGLA